MQIEIEQDEPKALYSAQCTSPRTIPGRILTLNPLRQIRDRYYKVDVTLSGLIAAGHLIGGSDLDSALKEKFLWGEAEDDNGTSALRYMRDMGGLDLEGVLGGIK